ncbi:MAG TPA: hypothetical protein VF181_02580 [Balneolaceae bacterium]
MVKRRIKLYIGYGLLMLMSIGLTITTLHSHHHLDLNHPPNFVDTGTCITADTTVCPICGIIPADIPSFSSAVKVVFQPEEVIIDSSASAANTSFIVSKGRSPPLTA